MCGRFQQVQPLSWVPLHSLLAHRDSKGININAHWETSMSMTWSHDDHPEKNNWGSVKILRSLAMFFGGLQFRSSSRGWSWLDVLTHDDDWGSHRTSQKPPYPSRSMYAMYATKMITFYLLPKSLFLFFSSTFGLVFPQRRRGVCCKAGFPIWTLLGWCWIRWIEWLFSTFPPVFSRNVPVFLFCEYSTCWLKVAMWKLLQYIRNYHEPLTLW